MSRRLALALLLPCSMGFQMLCSRHPPVGAVRRAGSPASATTQTAMMHSTTAPPPPHQAPPPCEDLLRGSTLLGLAFAAPRTDSMDNGNGGSNTRRWGGGRGGGGGRGNDGDTGEEGPMGTAYNSTSLADGSHHRVHLPKNLHRFPLLSLMHRRVISVGKLLCIRLLCCCTR
jgi:hypothetical protein